MTRKANIKSLEELLAHALAMESEAAERYGELADQMAVHNNSEVEKLFRKLAEIEQLHRDKISNLAKGATLPHIAPWEFRWNKKESPEAPEAGEIHYLIQPYHAIELSMRHEQYAADFYAGVAKTAKRKDVKELAETMAAEEDEHVRLLKEWLVRYPKPDTDWDHDLDPPMEQE